MSYGVFGTELVLLPGGEATTVRRAAVVMIEQRMSDTWTIGGGAGAGLPGFIEVGGERYSVDPGWVFSIASSWRLLDGRGKLPFLLLSMTFGGSGSTTHRESEDEARDPAAIYALDVRAGLLVGKTFWDTLSPYAAVRAFGGPVFWELHGETVFGTDLRHFQVALGVSSVLPGGVDLFAEVAPLGERAASVGVGFAF